MTPEWARTIYHAALGRAYIEYVLNWDKPLVQHQAELIAWKAVMDDPVVGQFENDQRLPAAHHGGGGE